MEFAVIASALYLLVGIGLTVRGPLASQLRSEQLVAASLTTGIRLIGHIAVLRLGVILFYPVFLLSNLMTSQMAPNVDKVPGTSPSPKEMEEIEARFKEFTRLELERVAALLEAARRRRSGSPEDT